MQGSTPTKKEFLAAILSGGEFCGKGSKGFAVQHPEHKLVVCPDCKESKVSWVVSVVY